MSDLDLVLAARQGSVENVQALLDSGVSVDCYMYRERFSALESAARRGNDDVVRLLLKNHATVDLPNDLNQTALFAAASLGNLSTVRILIMEGDATVVDWTDCCARTPLYFAARGMHMEVVKYLIEEGKADVDAQENGASTALWYAVNDDHSELVKYLVEAHARIDFDALANAAHGKLHILQYLLQNQTSYDVNQTDSQGDSLIHHAASNGSSKVVRFLIEKCGSKVNHVRHDGITPFFIACLNGRVAVARYLSKQKGVNINRTRRLPNTAATPLHVACRCQHGNIVRWMLEDGTLAVHLTKKDCFGQTARDCAKLDHQPIFDAYYHKRWDLVVHLASKNWFDEGTGRSKTKKSSTG